MWLSQLANTIYCVYTALKIRILNGDEMTRNEFIKLLKDNLKPNAQMDFLICDYKKPVVAFLDIKDVCMNVDVDDPDNKNRGGVVFTIKEDLMT